MSCKLTSLEYFKLLRLCSSVTAAGNGCCLIFKCVVSAALSFPQNSVLPLYEFVSSLFRRNPWWFTKTQFPHHKNCRTVYARCCASYMNYPSKPRLPPAWKVITSMPNGWSHGGSAILSTIIGRCLHHWSLRLQLYMWTPWRHSHTHLSLPAAGDCSPHNLAEPSLYLLPGDPKYFFLILVPIP